MVHIDARELDQRIELQRKTVVSDGYGGEVETWSQILKPWAKAMYGTGGERRVAAQESATLTATFRIRSGPTADSVTPQDRIVFAGAQWDIASNVPYGRIGRDITATRVV